MINFEITNTTLEDKIKHQGAWLDTEVTGQVMDFGKDLGVGRSFIRELESGLLIQAWDGVLHDDFRLFCRPVEENIPFVYMINYCIMTEKCLIESGSSIAGKRQKMTFRNSLVLSTNRSEFAFIIEHGGRLRDLDIIFNQHWLDLNFPDEKIRKLLAVLTREGLSQIMLESISNDDFIIVDDMLETVFKNEWDIVFLKSRVMTLLSETLNKLLLQDRNNKADVANEHLPVMIEVEKKLRSLLHEKMPNLDAIAKEFFMSESTLKRQFKQTYGKAIYEYYLDKKMEHAKRLLIDGDLSIAQIAYSLGYVKPSSFIKTFKKYFGVSPGSLRDDEV